MCGVAMALIIIVSIDERSICYYCAVRYVVFIWCYVLRVLCA